jgi:hypothetical protein
MDDEDIIGTEEVMEMAGEGENPSPLQQLLNFFSGTGGRSLAGLGLLTGAYGALGGIGERGLGLGQRLAEQQLQQAAFRPYTVTSATGGQFMAGPEGQYTLTLSPEEQAFQQQMFGGAGDFFTKAAADPTVREEQLYGQISEALAPEQRAQQLGLEERLAAQGRLGVRTAEFGGTPEALAMQKAQAQQLSQARLGAAQQARQEQMGLAQLGQQYLGAGYIPQAQLLSALTPGQTAAAQAQQAQLYGTGLFGEATASGIDALLGSALGQANLMGTVGAGLLSGVAQGAGTGTGQPSYGGGFFDDVLGLDPNFAGIFGSIGNIFRRGG